MVYWCSNAATWWNNYCQTWTLMIPLPSLEGFRLEQSMSNRTHHSNSFLSINLDSWQLVWRQSMKWEQLQHYPESCPDTFVHAHTQDAYSEPQYANGNCPRTSSACCSDLANPSWLVRKPPILSRRSPQVCWYCNISMHSLHAFYHLLSDLYIFASLVLPSFLCEVMPLISPSHYLGDPQMLKP